MAGRAYRETMNMAHYDEWMNSHWGHGHAAHEIIKHSEEAGIAPAKLLDFVCENDIQSTELAKLSVLYGYRIEYIPELRNIIDQTILDRGGTLLRGLPYGHIHVAPHRSDDSDHLSGILATYQHNIGQTIADDGTPVIITERQALAIRTDTASGFSQDLHQRIMSQNKHVSAAAMEEVKQFIQDDLNEKFMVPLSLTVFAHREKFQPRAKDVPVDEAVVQEAILERARQREEREKLARAERERAKNRLEAVWRVHMAAVALRETTE